MSFQQPAAHFSFCFIILESWVRVFFFLLRYSSHTTRKLKTENYTVETSKKKKKNSCTAGNTDEKRQITVCFVPGIQIGKIALTLSYKIRLIISMQIKKAALYRASLAVMEYYTLMVDQHDRPVGYQTENIVVMAYQSKVSSREDEQIA